MNDDRVVPVEQVTDLATRVGTIAALALIQSKGDASNAIARLESQRSSLFTVRTEDGWEVDVIEMAQQAVNAAAEICEPSPDTTQEEE